MNWVGFFVGYKVTIVGNKNLLLFNKNNMSGVTPFYFFFFFIFILQGFLFKKKVKKNFDFKNY